MTLRKLTLAIALCASVIIPVAGHAAEVRVLTAGAMKPIVEAIVPAFEKATGHKVKLQNDTAGGLVKRVSAGEPFDVVIAPPAAIEQMVPSGKLAPAPVISLAQVGVGIAVKGGEASPDIGSTEAFKTAIRNAKKIAYIDPAAGGSSGIYLQKLFGTLGLADVVKAKAVLVPGGLVAEKLVSGEADLALHQISEILAVPGVKLVGPLPDELQNYTVYTLVRAAKVSDKAAVDTFANLISGPAASEAIVAKGMQQIVSNP